METKNYKGKTLGRHTSHDISHIRYDEVWIDNSRKLILYNKGKTVYLEDYHGDFKETVYDSIGRRVSTVTNTGYWEKWEHADIYVGNRPNYYENSGRVGNKRLVIAPYTIYGRTPRSKSEIKLIEEGFING